MGGEHSLEDEAMALMPIELGKLWFLNGARLEWIGDVANQTREALQMHPHRITSQLKVRTKSYELNIYSVVYVDRRQTVIAPSDNAGLQEDDGKTGYYHLLDFEFARMANKSECMEGVWGRTSCKQQSDFDMTLYVLSGQLFSESFPFNLYQL